MSEYSSDMRWRYSCNTLASVAGCGPPCLPAWLLYYATLCMPHRCTAPESLLVNRCEQDWLAHRNTAAAEHPLLHPAMGQLAPLSPREVTSPSQRLSCVDIITGGCSLNSTLLISFLLFYHLLPFFPDHLSTGDDVTASHFTV